MLHVVAMYESFVITENAAQKIYYSTYISICFFVSIQPQRLPWIQSTVRRRGSNFKRKDTS